MVFIAAEILELLRQLLRLKQPKRLVDEEDKTPASPRWKEKPYYGEPVPLEASHDPNDSESYADIAEQFSVVPASDDKGSVLVFSVYFLSESIGGKTVIYDEDEMWHQDHDHRQRFKDTIKIYEHLQQGRDCHPRIVRYLGPTSSGYRLERVSLGPVIPCEVTSDAILALYQRWAMQGLSALQWLHDRGVVLQGGAFQHSNMWLRSDLSIAVVGIAISGCSSLDIKADHCPSNCFPSPWDSNALAYRESEDVWWHSDFPKSDIVDWATWVYELMTGDSRPLLHDFPRPDNTTWSERERLAERGLFKDWPILSTEMLGPILIRAWNGEYASAAETLEYTRQTLEKCGRTLTEDQPDEIDGFDWNSLFEVGVDEYGRSKLKLRTDDVKHESNLNEFQVSPYHKPS